MKKGKNLGLKIFRERELSLKSQNSNAKLQENARSKIFRRILLIKHTPGV